MEQRYTVAPPDYDGFGTRTVAMTGVYTKQGKEFRLVEIEPRYLDWQLARYSSGLQATLPAADFQKWQEYGFISASYRPKML